MDDWEIKIDKLENIRGYYNSIFIIFECTVQIHVIRSSLQKSCS